MSSLKEDVDVYKMYGKESIISKDEFVRTYNVNENRLIR